MARPEAPNYQLDGMDTAITYRKLTMAERWNSQPLGLIAKLLFSSSQGKSKPAPSPNPVLAVCITDVQNLAPEITLGSILIHVGSLSQDGSAVEIQRTLDWLATQPHAVKVAIAGHRDYLLDSRLDGTKQYSAQQAAKLRSRLRWHDIIYLENETKTVTIPTSKDRQLKIFGSPYTPQNGNLAFQYPRHMDFWESQIPEDTDVLVTHGPPRAHLDGGYGCVFLLSALWRTRPRLHAFGLAPVGPSATWLHFDSLQEAYENTVLYESYWFLLVTVFWWLRSWMGYRKEEPLTLTINALIAEELRGTKTGEPAIMMI